LRIPCTQCGAEVEITETEEFLECPFCQSALYVDLKRTVLNTVIEPSLEEKDAPLLVEKHLFAHQVLGDIVWEQSRLSYIPFWEVTDGGRSHVQPAVSLTDSELIHTGPGSGTKKIRDPDAADSDRMVLPDIYAETVLERMREKGLLADEPEGISLVHAPFIEVRYLFLDKSYTAYVDAVSGAVLAETLPPSPRLKLDRRFGVLMGLALATFTIEGLLLGILWGTAAIVATAVPFYYIARKLVV